jgi:hypothetical protein
VSLDLVCPATVNANDILIAQVIHTGTATAPTTPANWTLLYGPVNIGITPAGRHWVFGKLAVGTEDGATIGFGTDGGTNGRAGRIYRCTGWVAGTITDVVPAASFSNIEHDTDPQGPSITTTVAGALAVALTTQTDNNTEEAMTGMSGGTWGGFVTFVSTTLGPVGLHIDIEVATPTANPGTISGGAMTATNDPASTIGFEIRDSMPVITGSGTPDAQPSTMAGSGVSSSSSTDGAISAQATAVTASGLSASLSTAGVLIAQEATVGGVGTVETPAITGTGVLLAQATGLAASGISSSAGSGVLTTASSLAGTGLAEWSGTGSLLVQAATLDGAGLTISTGTGALLMPPALLSGSGLSQSSGTGVLAVSSFTMQGAGLTVSTGTGILLAQLAQCNGLGLTISTGTGDLTAQTMTMAGIGVVGDAGVTGTATLLAASATCVGVGATGSTGTGVFAGLASLLAGTGLVVAMSPLLPNAPSFTFRPAHSRMTRSLRQYPSPFFDPGPR